MFQNQVKIFPHQKLVGVLLVTTFSVLSSTGLAIAADKRAQMSIDVNTGRVLHSSNGDALRHPASLTKMMTLYMVFDLIKRGRLSNTTLITVKQHAADQPPSKLGLKVGDKIKLIHAMKSLVTKSANDAAVAIAEHIAGSEYKFAQLMTSKAKALGMHRTVFRNASGLPDKKQVTTARDMLTLAVRLQKDFGKQYSIFKLRSFKYAGKRYRNHNTLLGRIKGVDGIKTGYIRASGFNLVTSVKRDRKHVVAAVFGGKTAKSRNAQMRRLIKRSLRKASKIKPPKPQLIARATPPRRPVSWQATAIRSDRPAGPQRVTRRNAPTGATNPQVKIAKVRKINVIKEPRKSDYQTALQPPSNGRVPRQWSPPTPGRTATKPLPATQGRGRAPSTLQDQLSLLLAQSNTVRAHRAAPVQTAATAPPGRPQPAYGLQGPAPFANQQRMRAPHDHHIQVGAFASQSEAQQRLAAVAELAGGALSRHRPYTQPVNSGRRTLYRARFAGFSATSAAQVCLDLRRKSVDCMVTRGR